MHSERSEPAQVEPGVPPCIVKIFGRCDAPAPAHPANPTSIIKTIETNGITRPPIINASYIATRPVMRMPGPHQVEAERPRIKSHRQPAFQRPDIAQQYAADATNSGEPTMDNARRSFLMLGTAAASTLLASQAFAAPADISVPSMPGPHGDVLRLVTFIPAPGAAPRIGAVTNGGMVVDIGAAASAKGLDLAFDPASMIALTAAGPAGIAQARLCAAYEKSVPLSSVRLLAPIPVPARNVYGVGWNYLEHFHESLTARAAKAALPKHPVFFTKDTHTVNGPYDPIPFNPAVSTKIDWEGELAVIIGKHGRNVSQTDAMNYVFGYAVINDTTARDMQADHGGQWFKGKSLDGHGPLGPWIIPAADIDYNNLNLSTRVNGVTKQSINTSQMYFKIPRLIAELSLGLTLEPGDIIATGTPSGIGAARNPPEFLKPGDILETEIDRIGTIRNEIRLVQA
jgi:2-keto-4-pentenoate hydratase/2-oxohepta-3-ene-1,7-dioic acid hydratase in catechol pathway